MHRNPLTRTIRVTELHRVTHNLTRLGVRLTRLARGLPMGSSLEYADEVTLTRALEGRQPL